MKKNILFYSILIFTGSVLLSGNITFAQSTTLAADGVYVPRLTTTQRNAISSPTAGQMIYNTDDDCFNVYQKDSWQKLCGLNYQATDSWTRKADFAGNERKAAVGFSIGNKGYIGTGDINGNTLKDFWEYDPLTDTWTQKADVGETKREYAVGFSIGNKGYIGTGYNNEDSNFLKDFWEYDPTTNRWVQKADFGGAKREQAVGFSIGNKGYIGTGYGVGLLKDFWEYDPTSTVNGTDVNGNPKGKWLQKADVGGPERYGAVGISTSNKGYIGTGYDENDVRKDFWEYNPVTNEWIQKADFGGTPRGYAVGFSLGDKSYIGTGFNNNNYTKGFWEYNPTSTINGIGADGKPKGSWLQKKDVGTGQIESAVGFSIGNKGYIVMGYPYSKNLWEYNPNDSNLTLQGNAFNGVSQLVQTDNTGKISTSILPNFALLNDSGFLGIGTSNPKAQIHLSSLLANKKIILWGDADNAHEFYGFGVNGGSLRYQVDHSGAAHVFYAAESTTASKELFRINGNGSAVLAGNLVTNGSSSSSDIRYKRHFSSIENPLAKVLQMNGFQYYWKTEQFKEKNFPESRQIGFIAQEVEQLFPELVNTDEKGYKSVDYARLTPVLVEAIKELKQENNAIRKEIEALKNVFLQAQNGK
ncbi:tail fiber domain-containing protein [Emticicia sp. C21]|uniref:tail fiber domain-containing protein n=1 Tax=Emticicia sp. C21 TaxID=2302915 RepID=UPI001314AAD9|nr:tail fiber domain-containing protein [Emticicia sp. C21]